ncbi:MAG: class I SAM-dependent methyltransferase [Chromatiales bacterium]|jgi:ubiquinone/menaquinone biosynthesis C-methylase UbiE|nr:class I SAM-dependent methyltransferase [Chromatiales bacterium]
MRSVSTTRPRPWQLAPLPQESEAQLHERQDRAYFEEQITDSDDWWWRMGDAPHSLEDMRVLDFGCGHGALSVLACKRGAASVTGIDLDRRRIDFARRHTAMHYPRLASRLRFIASDVGHLEEDGSYDVILSKDAFEHVDDLKGTVAELRRLLKPGGRLMVGFSPLFYSPFGDHGRLAPKLPWLPALLPERLVLAMARKRHGKPIRSMADVGLNKLTPAQFRATFSTQDWELTRLAYNRSRKRMMPVMNALRRLPGMERWFTAGIYAVAVRR